MAGGTKPKPKRQKTTTANNTQTTPSVHWTTEEKKARNKISHVTPLPTRFANREILERMGLLDTFDELLKKIGLSAFGTLDAPTFPLPTLDFLSTMQYTFVNPKVPMAKEGIIHFKIKNSAYSISIPDLCEAYGFANNTSMCFPQFKGIHDLWNVLANGTYLGSSAKIKKVRQPVIRYVLKLIAHAFFGRGDTGSATVTELCFIFQGVKHLLVDDGGDAESNQGDSVEDELGNDVNYGCVFATYLVSYKRLILRGKTNSTFIGGTLTPLFTKAGVDLSQFTPYPERSYLDHQYLMNTCSLRKKNNLNTFIHLFIDREGIEKECILPSQELTTLEFHDDVEFLPDDEDCNVPIEQPLEAQEESPSPPTLRDDPYHLNTYALPKVKFTPRTKTEKILHSVIKIQKKINKWQAYAIGKLFRKVKKLQPPNYVSSEEDNEAPSSEEQNEDGEDNEEASDDESHETSQSEEDETLNNFTKRARRSTRRSGSTNP